MKDRDTNRGASLPEVKRGVQDAVAHTIYGRVYLACQTDI